MVKRFFLLTCFVVVLASCSEKPLPDSIVNRSPASSPEKSPTPQARIDKPDTQLSHFEVPSNPFETATENSASQPNASEASSNTHENEEKISDPSQAELPEPLDTNNLTNQGTIKVRGNSTSLNWDTESYVQYENLDLVISTPDGRQINKSFSGGTLVEINENLPDGTYAWESITQPYVAPDVRERMKEVRESGNFEAEQKLVAELRQTGQLPTEKEASNNIRSGHFSIINGVIAEPEIEEPSRHGG